MNKLKERLYFNTSEYKKSIVIFSSLLLIENIYDTNLYAQGKVFKKRMYNSIRVEWMSDRMGPELKKVLPDVEINKRANSMSDVLNNVNSYSKEANIGIKLNLDHYLSGTYNKLANEQATLDLFTKSIIYNKKGLIEYINSTLAEKDRAIIGSLMNNYILNRNGIKNSIENYIKKVNEKESKTATILGSKFTNGPYGHVKEQLVFTLNLAYALAIAGKEEELKKLYKAVEKKESYNLKDFSLPFNKHIHLNEEKLLAGLLYSAIFDEKGKCKLSPDEIKKLKDVEFGKEGKSKLYQNNDKAADYVDGYLSGEVVKGVKSSADVLNELKLILEEGKISSSFDAGLNYADFVSNPKIGFRYEAVKIYAHNLILTQIYNQAPRYSKSGEVLRQFPLLALIFEDAAYKTLIRAVSVSDMTKQEDQITKAKNYAEVFYYLVPKIIDKANDIMLSGKDKEVYKDNKPDYYLFMPYLVQGVFDTVQDGKEREIGVNFGAINVTFNKKTVEPLNNYLSTNRSFPSNPEKFARDIINSISGDCAVQQVRFKVQLVKKENGISAVIKEIEPNRIILGDKVKINPKSSEISTPIFSGFPGEWTARQDLSKESNLAKELDLISLKDNSSKFSINLQKPISQTSITLNVSFVSGGNNLKPYNVRTQDFEIPPPEPTPISIPFFLKTEIETGGGIGGVPPGFDTRFNSPIYNLVGEAWSLQQNADKNPKNLMKANQLLYKAISEAYKLDPSKVGGDKTKQWIADNKDSINEGKFKTPLPIDLINSQFGSELSLANVPNQLKLNETRSVNIIDIALKKSDLYIKTGWIQYDTKYIYGQIKDYDENGNPIYEYKEKTDSKKSSLVGLGYNLKLEGEKKLKLEIFGGNKDWTIKTMSEEDRTILQKVGQHIIKEWEGSALKLSGKKIIELVNLFDEVSLTKYNDRWLMQARTNNLSIPLTVPLSWIGIHNVPTNINWRSVFSANVVDGAFKASLNKELSNILELNLKSQRYTWTIWEYFNGNISSPKGIGTELQINGQKMDLGIGISFVPKPGQSTVNLKDLFKENIVNGHLSFRF